MNERPGPAQLGQDGYASLQQIWLPARDRWAQGSNAPLVSFVDQQIHALSRIIGAEGFAKLLTLIDGLGEIAVQAALQVTSRLEYLLDRVDVDGLGRWILTGLRMYPGDPDPQRRYFSLEDPVAVAALGMEASEQNASQHFVALSFYLNGLSGGEFTIQARHQTVLNGPPARPVIVGNALLLPDCYTMLDAEDRPKLYRAAVAHAVAHIRYSPRKQTTAGLKPLGIAVVSTIEDARVERLLVQDYPGLHQVFLSFLRDVTKEKNLTFESLTTRLHHALLDPEYQDDNYWVNKGRQLFEENSGDLKNYKKFREIASILANDLGQMRVRFNAQQYAVTPAYCDDNSYLWDSPEDSAPAPPEQDVEISGARLEPVESEQEQNQADSDDTDEQPADLPMVAFETPAEEKFSYPEWDYRIDAVRDAWCTVVERTSRLDGATAGAADELAGVPRHIVLPRLMRRSQVNRAVRLRRQWEGDEIDINAAIDVLVDRRNNLSTEARIFLKHGRAQCNASILVLIDLSESTNDRIAGRFDSILDLEKKAALMLANAFSGTSHRLAVHGFSSDTRHEVHYYRFLEFGEPMTAQQAKLLRNTQAAYSTRMGAALRHASALLSMEVNEKKIVIMVTDGAPGDIDVFDDEYLIQDTRVGVSEAQARGIDCFCLSVDANAEDYVKRIFGAKNYRIVDDPLSLPAQLSMVFAQITSR